MPIFEGCVSLITGGASGIGAALAESLVAQGAIVAIIDIDAERANELANVLGDSARAYACDVTDRAQVEALALAVSSDLGGIDLVFANAGVAVPGTLLDTDPREYAWMLDVNVASLLHIVQVFAPPLITSSQKGRPARFIITGSDNALGISGAVCSAYSASKHAVLGFADALRRDLEGAGVAVSIVCPGVVNTRIWDGRSTRQARYGGPQAFPPDMAEQAATSMATIGRNPHETARICLEGVANGEFLIITDPAIRPIAERRGHEVAVALDRLDQRLAALSE